jgi:hypothetical protein
MPYGQKADGDHICNVLAAAPPLPAYVNEDVICLEVQQP